MWEIEIRRSFSIPSHIPFTKSDVHEAIDDLPAFDPRYLWAGMQQHQR